MKVFVGGCSRCDWVYYQFAPLELVTEQEIDREYKTNVAGLILTIQEAVKHFGAEGGSVINISSIASTGDEPMMVVYAATKSAVDSITRVLARELLKNHTLLCQIHYVIQGSTEKGKQDLQAAIRADLGWLPNDMLATIYDKEGNWEEAKRFYEKAHELEPASPDAANNLASLYLEHGGNVNVALSLAQMAKQKAPDSPQVADTLGWAYYKLGSYESAIEELKECVKRAPNDPAYQYHLGMAYMAAAERDLAKVSLEKALSLNPSFPYAASARAALEKISKNKLLLRQYARPGQ